MAANGGVDGRKIGKFHGLGFNVELSDGGEAIAIFRSMFVIIVLIGCTDHGREHLASARLSPAA